MDPDVRSTQPGQCPRCGMKLVQKQISPLEFPLSVTVEPRAWKPNEPIRITFEILDPVTGKRCTRFQIVHEKLLHLFILSQDLNFFAHEHPVHQQDGTFVFETKLPKPGMYRLAADYYPDSGTPQIAVATVISAGDAVPPLTPASLEEDRTPQKSANLRVILRSQPEVLVAGTKSLLWCDLSPSDQLEKYLGAWGHLLVASDDLVDLIHTHPFIADGNSTVQFNVVFPRPGKYRMWAQFQRASVVNTAQFTLDVKALSL